MKRKAILCLLLAVMTLFAASTAHADLFPSLHPSQPTPAPQPEEAPSYSAFANVDYDDAQPYGESGQTVYSYENVTEESYMSFGNYLEERGFQTTAAEVNGATVQMMITDGHFNIGVVYYGDQQKLLVIYESGVAPAEKELFPGYTKLGLNEEIVIKNLGKFTFTEFRLNGPKVTAATYRDYKGRLEFEYDRYTSLMFTYFNIKTTETRYWSGYSLSEKANDLLTVKIVYINEYNKYTYDQESYGRCLNDVVYYRNEIGSYVSTSAKATDPLTTLKAGVVFDLPQAVRTATDGTLALLLDFNTGEKYYIPIREDGVAVK